MAPKTGIFSGRGRVVRKESRAGKDILILDIIYYFVGPLSGTLTYPDKLEEVIIDPETKRGTYSLTGRFDGKCKGKSAINMSAGDSGHVDLTTKPHPTWTGYWMMRHDHSLQLEGTIKGALTFKSETDFVVGGNYTVA